MKVRFCTSCGRLILADFMYCPYCGSEAFKAPSLAEVIETPFDRLEERAAAASVAGKIAELSAELERLEADMETLLETRGES